MKRMNDKRVRVGVFEEITFKFWVEGPGVTDVLRLAMTVLVVKIEMARSSGGRSFQRRGAENVGHAIYTLIVVLESGSRGIPIREYPGIPGIHATLHSR